MPRSKQPYPSRRFEGLGGREVDIAYDPRDFEPVTPYTNELKDEYAEAQNTLIELRQREEQIRKQAEALEEISQKEEAFTQGRHEVIEQIEAYLETLDREAAESRFLAQECEETHRRLHHQLSAVQSLRPETWDRNDRGVELDRALRQIEAAEEEMSRGIPLLDEISGSRSKRAAVHVPGPVAGNVDPLPLQGDFLYWLKAGIAFTLPTMTLAIVITVLILYFK